MKVSVVITTYKRPEGLCKTLGSIESQSRLPDEVIISDDGTDFDYSKLVEETRTKFDSFRFEKNETNLGMPGNLNQAISLANGDLIINLHDGDEYREDLVEKCEDRLNSVPSAGMVFWASTKNFRYPRGIAEVTPGRLFFEQHYLLGSSSKIWGTAAVRKGIYEKLGLFDPKYGVYADVDMWMRICRIADICYLPEPLMDLEPDSLVRRWSWKNPLITQSMILQNIDRMYADEPEVREHARKKQLEVQRNQWFRHMARRILNVDLKEIYKGIRIAPQYFRKSSI